jgi:hypothetical protein
LLKAGLGDKGPDPSGRAPAPQPGLARPQGNRLDGS